MVVLSNRSKSLSFSHSTWQTQNVSKLTIWACSDDVTMQIMHLMLIYVCLFKNKIQATWQGQRSHWALCICAHDRQDVAGSGCRFGGLAMRRAIFPPARQEAKNSNRSPPETRCQNQGHVPDKNGRRLTRCPVFVQLALSSWLNAPQSVAIHGVVQWLACEQTFDKKTTRTRFIRPYHTNQGCRYLLINIAHIKAPSKINRPVESSFTSVAFLLMSFDS